MPTKAKAEVVSGTEVAPEQVTVSRQGLALLMGFRDLVAERFGYWLGVRLTREDMNQKTESERKTASEIRKALADGIPTYIENADLEGYKAKVKELKDANEVVSKVGKPFREKISPLAKGVRYIDNVAIPDALKELGTPISPRFSLSKYVADGIEAAKKK